MINFSFCKLGMVFAIQNRFLIWGTFLWKQIESVQVTDVRLFVCWVDSISLMLLDFMFVYCIRVGLPSLYRFCINAKEAVFPFVTNSLAFLFPPWCLFILDFFKYAPKTASLAHCFPKLYIICYILEVGNGKKSTISSLARTGYSSLIIDLSDVKWILHLISPGEEK